MRVFYLLLLIAFFLGTKVLAASTEEENRFVNAVREAFATKDSAAFLALYCWDGVTPEIKQFQIEDAEESIKYKVKSVTFIPVGKNRRNWKYEDKGVTYVLNLNPVKDIIITVADIKFQGTMTMAVGEKDGKLYFVLPRPQQ